MDDDDLISIIKARFSINRLDGYRITTMDSDEILSLKDIERSNCILITFKRPPYQKKCIKFGN